MKGYVGVCAAESSRYSQFWAELETLEAPDGVQVHINYDGTLSHARNAHVEAFLKTDAGWCMMIDDDHAISPDYLRRWLYRHEGKINEALAYPIVSTLYLMRGAPFAPIVYGAPEYDPVTDRTSLPLIALTDLPTTGVITHTLSGRQIFATGASGVFVRRDVYERMDRPWYELGCWDQIGEDFAFCVKAQRLGYPVRLDVEARIGHLAPFAVWPMVVDGQWTTAIQRHGFTALVDPADTASLSVAFAPPKALAGVR